MSEAQKRHQVKRLEDALKRPENRECFDCATIHPRWASTNLGIFICMRCAGIHRGLGTHISKVKNVTLDVWEEHMIQNCENIGNGVAKELYPMPPGVVRPGPEAPVHTVERIARLKYEGKGDLASNLSPQFKSPSATAPVAPIPSGTHVQAQHQQQNPQQSSSQVLLAIKKTASTTPSTIIQGTVIHPSPTLFGGVNSSNGNGGNLTQNNDAAITKKSLAGLDDIFGGNGNGNSNNNNNNNNGNNSIAKTKNNNNNNNSIENNSNVTDDIFGDFVCGGNSTVGVSSSISATSSTFSSAVAPHHIRPHHHGHHGNHPHSGRHPSSGPSTQVTEIDLFGSVPPPVPHSFIPATTSSDFFGASPVRNGTHSNNNNVYPHSLIQDPFASLAGGTNSSSLSTNTNDNSNNNRPVQFQQHQQHQQQQTRKTAVDDLFA